MRRWVRPLGLAIGLILLAAAIVVIWNQRSTLVDARSALLNASPARLATLVFAIGGNVVLSGLMFSLLMSRYGRVGLLEMQALIAATSLLNYLPLRAGLLGRLAYHQRVNGIPITMAGRTVLQAIVLSVAVAAYLAGLLLVAGLLGGGVGAGLLLPIPILALGGLWPGGRIWCWAALLRHLDVLLWTIRYHTAFALLGSPIPVETAVVLACVSVVATMVPFFSNGLGLREWAVALAAPLISSAHLELALSAELVNRAAEMVVVLVLGLAGLLCLARSLRKRATIPA